MKIKSEVVSFLIVVVEVVRQGTIERVHIDRQPPHQLVLQGAVEPLQMRIVVGAAPRQVGMGQADRQGPKNPHAEKVLQLFDSIST